MERSSAGAWKIQQRAVGRHKQRRSDSSALASCLQKESKHGRTAGALFSDPPGNGGDGLPGALRLTACYGLLRATKNSRLQSYGQAHPTREFFGLLG